LRYRARSMSWIIKSVTTSTSVMRALTLLVRVKSRLMTRSVRSSTVFRSVEIQGQINVMDHQVGDHVHIGDARTDLVGPGEVQADDALGAIEHGLQIG